MVFLKKIHFQLIQEWGYRGHDRMELDLQLPDQSVSINTNIVSSNLAHGEVYTMQLYVIKFVSDLR